MNQFAEFFNELLSTNDWPPRWHCGEWSDFHGWLYIASDISIWLAYFIIPVVIIWFIQKKPNIPFLPVFWLFGFFIILCGTTHILDAIIFWWPGYRLSALLRFFTALVSFVTVFALIRDLPKVLALGDIVQDQNQIEDLENTIEEQKSEIARLEAKITQLTVEG